MAFRDIFGAELWKKFLDLPFVAGQKLREHFGRVRDTITEAVRRRIIDGWEAGESTAEIAASIRPPETVDGTGDSIAARAYREIDQITSDALQGMLITAQELLITVNRGIVGRFVWLSQLDSRVCKICAALHSTVTRIDRSRISLRTDRLFSVRTPPAHVRCRCTLAFARTGEPLPRVQRFDEWLRDQEDETVTDVLGKTRARLFRDGDLTVRDFVRDDEIYTLRELRARNRDAFEQAGIENLRAS